MTNSLGRSAIRVAAAMVQPLPVLRSTPLHPVPQLSVLLPSILLLPVLLLLAGCSAATPDHQEPLSFDRVTLLETEGFTSANASLGDLDGDGDLDIVLAKGRHWPLANQVLINDGRGGFDRRHPVGEADRTYTAALADLDGDGDLDLVVGNDRPDPKRLFRNDGRGNFEPGGTFGQPEWSTRNVTVADLNGDDRPEIIVANRGGPENRSANYICDNSGDGTFASCRVLSQASATTIAAGDLNADGAIDLVVPHRDGGQSFVYLNDGAGGFTDARAIGPAQFGTRAVALGDLNGDGWLDVILGDQDEGGVQVYFGNPNAKFEQLADLTLAEGEGEAYSIAIADLNEDGHLDLVLGNRDARSIVLRNLGQSNGFELTYFADAEGAVYGLAVGDLTGDGKVEIVAARSDAPNAVFSR